MNDKRAHNNLSYNLYLNRNKFGTVFGLYLIHVEKYTR